MKILLSSILLLLTCLTNATAQTGNAIIFDYDANGQRVLRHLDPAAVLNKYGDTLTRQSPPDTLRGVQGNLAGAILVKAYPNPTADEVIIENLSWKDPSEAVVKIFDIAGKLIQTNRFSAPRKEFSLASVVPGVYQVHYYLNGELLTTWKIIKK